MYQPGKELTVTEIAHPCLTKWRKRIDAAEKRGEFNSDDDKLAADWDQCAVGEAHCNYMVLFGKLSLYEENNPPTDRTLYNLGIQFTQVVSYGETGFSQARDILTHVEQRLAELQAGSPVNKWHSSQF